MTEIIPQYRIEIEQIASVGQASEQMKKAQAISALYKARDEKEKAQEARRYYLEVARQVGRILWRVPRSNGGRPENSLDVQPVTEYQEAAEDAGVSRHTLYQWQRLAEIPDKVFEKYLDEPRYMWGEYTVNGLLRYASATKEPNYTPEGLIKTIMHFVKMLLKRYPEAREMLIVELRKVIG